MLKNCLIMLFHNSPFFITLCLLTKSLCSKEKPLCSQPHMVSSTCNNTTHVGTNNKLSRLTSHKHISHNSCSSAALKVATSRATLISSCRESALSFVRLFSDRQQNCLGNRRLCRGIIDASI